MPLHLLGKKSWNVYNTANIEKVRADEAAATAREAAEEQRMQEVDAERRIQVLRGLQLTPLTSAPEHTHTSTERIEGAERTGGPGRDRKRRRIDGENDTERDIRYAKESQSLASTDESRHLKRHKPSNAPLTDRAGHINLFPAEGPRRGGPKNPEAEAEAATKKKEYEDQYTMRFSNAAGFKQSISEKPWYHSGLGLEKEEEEEIESVGKDVWGNEDPRRKERQKMRVVADDPLAAIQKGVKDLRQVERQKRVWIEEQKREIKAIEKAERRRMRKERGVNGDGILDGFSLDEPEIGRSQRREKHRHGGSEHRHDSQSKVQYKDMSHERRHYHKHSERKKDITGWEVGPSGRYSSQFTDIKN
ncbi:hypothetical protein MMC18_003233 [Xylographa bjoerkii]|nr:hypothetical protein [Xylographa bjoerkii]